MNSVQSLTHFIPLVSFYTPGKRQKTRGFLMFSGCIESDQWHEMISVCYHLPLVFKDKLT